MRKVNERLHSWWGCTYASFLTIPRVLMQEMPDEWQEKMAELLEEYDETFDTTNLGVDSTTVRAVRNGKMCKMPECIKNYRHPDRAAIENMKRGNK